MSATTRKCNNPDCGEWYDARSASCYICGGEDRERNEALVRAVETSRMNSALAQQVGIANQEARADAVLRSARQDPSGRAFAAARPNVPGYKDLVEGIKNSLEEHPHVAEYFGPEGR